MHTQGGAEVVRWYPLQFAVCTRLCGPTEWVTVIGNVSQPANNPTLQLWPLRVRRSDISNALCKRRKIVKPKAEPMQMKLLLDFEADQGCIQIHIYIYIYIYLEGGYRLDTGSPSEVTQFPISFYFFVLLFARRLFDCLAVCRERC